MRYFNVFGPRQDPKSAYAAAIPIFTEKAVGDQDMNIYGDGEQTRDFVYVKDVVATNVFLAQSEFTGVYNVAYGKAITINDLTERIKVETDSDSKVVHLDERAGDIKHSLASVQKLFNTGFKPTSDFDAGLNATIDYFKDRK
jgi:UDP-glucose 4-epimerase